MSKVIITTTDEVQGHTIKEYIGLVASHAWTHSKNIGSGPIEKDRIKALPEYRKFIKLLESHLQDEAISVGANAVVGIKFQFSTAPLGAVIYAHGTAVLIE